VKWRFTISVSIFAIVIGVLNNSSLPMQALEESGLGDERLLSYRVIVLNGKKDA
jgi:hypothetical protein